MAATFELVEATGATRTAVILHGILGRGRNWRTFARKLVKAYPGWRVILVDQRHHGAAPPSEPPNNLVACAEDLEELCARLGVPDLVIGHSFGGKVALTWADLYGGPETTVWVLDSPPGLPDQAVVQGELARVMAALEGAPMPAPERGVVRDYLREAGLSESMVMWLLTSVVRRERGWGWVYDLRAVREMLASYFVSDLWEVAEQGPCEVHLVRAERSDRWTQADLARGEAEAGGLCFHVLEGAGHWVQVDAPAELLALLGRSFAR